MKLNKLIHESAIDEYMQTAERLIDYDYNFYMTKGGIINRRECDKSFTLSNVVADRCDLFTDDGVSKLKFGKVCTDRRVFIIENIDIIKSLKNMPQEFFQMNLIGLPFVNIFDLEIIKCMNIEIEGCGFTDLTQVKNVLSTITITNCKKINSFDMLPHNHNTNGKKMYIKNMTIQQVKTKNKNIIHLNLETINGIYNFTHLPQNVKELNYRKMPDFNSWIGIDHYDSLKTLTTDTKIINNIISLVLCKGIYNADFINIFNIHGPIREIIKNKYLKIDLSERAEHIMDCAIELIDAGFEEAAEL